MAGQDRGGNEGMSGTPLWKIQQQMAQYRESLAAASIADQAVKIEDPPESPHVLVDFVSVGGPADAKQKFVRTVLVKDFHKIASRLKIPLPKTNVFKDKAPVGLYSLFDGQSCAGEPGVRAAEFCARNFHTKVLENLSQLPPNHATETFVKAALIKSFEDLDTDLLKNHPDVEDGCGAAVVLIVGGIAFTAVLGRCNVVLSKVANGAHRASSLGGSQREITSLEERARLRQAGVAVIGDGAMARLRHPSGALSPVGSSLGDAGWKGAKPIISCCPEVQSTTLQGSDTHPFMLLLASTVAAVLEPQQTVEFASEYYMAPRAACGEVCAKVLEATPGAHQEIQYSAVGVCYLPVAKKDEGPAAKKLKIAGSKAAMSSVRLRHILVKFAEPGNQARQIDGKGMQVTRSRMEAEAILRMAIRELANELKLSKKKPKDVAEKVLMESKMFATLARQISDCPTAKKGGSTCGDLGWMPQDQVQKMGGNFKENVEALNPGMWSDITHSTEGLHLIQKIA